MTATYASYFQSIFVYKQRYKSPFATTFILGRMNVTFGNFINESTSLVIIMVTL